MNRNNNFNFIRLLLAVLVLLTHAPQLVDGNNDREILVRLFGTITFGELAVNGFFLLSGYLIMQSWQRSPCLKNYLAKRALRIYPGFIVASILSAVVVGPLGSDVARYFSEFNAVKFLASLVLLRPPSVPGTFAGEPFPYVNSSLWTIAYEFRCYLLVALLGLLGINRYRRIWLILAMVSMALLPFAPILPVIPKEPWGVLLGEVEPLIRFTLYFSAGACFYLYQEKVSYKPALLWGALSLLALGMFDPRTVNLVLPTAGAYLLFFVAFLPVRYLQRFGTRADVSYGVYLYGWPVQILLAWYFPGISPWAVFLIACCMCFAIGWISWHFVESRFIKMKGKLMTPHPMEDLSEVYCAAPGQL